MAVVTIEGVGVFDVRQDKVGELMQWLNNNQAAKVESVDPTKEKVDGEFTGRTLINE